MLRANDVQHVMSHTESDLKCALITKAGIVLNSVKFNSSLEVNVIASFASEFFSLKQESKWIGAEINGQKWVILPVWNSDLLLLAGGGEIWTEMVECLEVVRNKLKVENQ